MKQPILFLAVTLAIAACATGRKSSPPIPRTGKAYDLAGEQQLPDRKPEEHEGLHNLYHLSDDIVSGGEPEGDAAFERLGAMGIKTILSVDGKAPDAATAARHGIRYVHVPIRYAGITEEERLEIAKTFRELEGPFYVHCFHGKHRGPAAAALGRVVLDGVPRELAIAEMRQYCGTSGKYEGLYSTIAFGDVPSEEATEACAFDFAPAHRFKGFRQAMIDISRSFETAEKLAKNGWKATDEHPDANAANEARRTAESFAQAVALDEVRSRPEDFRGWLADSVEESKQLSQLLDRQAKGDAAAGEEAVKALRTLKASCTACHTKYRNEGY
ncbi:MAG: hypothetical protein R3F30_11560 [Planctomycetota bacterium]